MASVEERVTEIRKKIREAEDSGAARPGQLDYMKRQLPILLTMTRTGRDGGREGAERLADVYDQILEHKYGIT